MWYMRICSCPWREPGLAKQLPQDGAGVRAPVADAESRRTRLVLATLILAIGLSYLNHRLGGGWVMASTITFLVILLDVVCIIRYRDRLLARFLLFGLLAGGVELLSDHWLVHHERVLVYAQGGPFLFSSPLYMPFAWAGMLVQLGFIGRWLAQRQGLLVASVMTALLGAVNIPLYEQWARDAGLWYYRDTLMWSNVPWGIIGAEFLLVLALPAVLRVAEHARPSWSAVLGILYGLWIWMSCLIAFALLG